MLLTVLFSSTLFIHLKLKFVDSFQNGIVRTKRGDYYIEPSKHHQINDAGHHPHIIFQRSAVKTTVSFLIL